MYDLTTKISITFYYMCSPSLYGSQCFFFKTVYCRGWYFVNLNTSATELLFRNECLWCIVYTRCRLKPFSVFALCIHSLWDTCGWKLFVEFPFSVNLHELNSWIDNFNAIPGQRIPKKWGKGIIKGIQEERNNKWMNEYVHSTQTTWQKHQPFYTVPNGND